MSRDLERHSCKLPFLAATDSDIPSGLMGMLTGGSEDVQLVFQDDQSEWGEPSPFFENVPEISEPVSHLS